MRISVKIFLNAVVLFVCMPCYTLANAPLTSSLPPLGDLAQASKWVNEGDGALTLGKVNEATADYHAALAASPFDESAMIGLARCATDSGSYSAAINYYQDAFRVNSDTDNNIDYMTEYTLVLSSAGETFEAISAYNHVVDLCAKGYCVTQMSALLPKFSKDGSDYDLGQLQAMTYLLRAMDCDYEHDGQALREIQKGLTLAPNSGLLYYYQGIFLQRESGSAQAAQQAWKKAIALSHGDAVEIAARRALAKAKKSA